MGVDARHGKWCATMLGVLALLCGIAYGRTLLLPFISDDYVQIGLARRWGPVSGWGDLLGDALYRCRATSLVLTYWTERIFGLDDLAFKLSSLAIHFLNSALVLALGMWRRIGWRLSAVAAGFFAIHQAHQEAVVWYAALPELLVFTFVLLTILAWLRWLDRQDGLYYAAAGVFFLLALFSKESAVVVTPILLLIAVVERPGWRSAAWTLPFGLAALAYFGSIYVDRQTHLHFNDGTFSLSGPFWKVMPRSISRLLWISGYCSVAILLVSRAWRKMPLIAWSLAWMAITFLPYSFLTYMPFVPSRHTYLASLAAAFIVASAFLTLHERFRNPAVSAVLATALVALQSAYIWTKKHDQFAERAAPTEKLVNYVRGLQADRVNLECFPYGVEVAERAVELRLGRKVVFTGPERIHNPDEEFCFDAAVVQAGTERTMEKFRNSP